MDLGVEAWVLCISKVIPSLMRQFLLPNKCSRKRCTKTYHFCHSLWFLLYLSYFCCAFMFSPTRLHPTGTEEQQKFRDLPSKPGRTRSVFLLLLLFWLWAGYTAAVEEIESMRSEVLLGGHRSGLARLWGRIGRAGKRDAGQTRWVGRMSHLQLQYIVSYSALIGVSWDLTPALPLGSS